MKEISRIKFKLALLKFPFDDDIDIPNSMRTESLFVSRGKGMRTRKGGRESGL